MRKTLLRSFKGMFAVTAFFALTGAKGDGCSTVESGPTEPHPAPAPAPNPCPEGMHLEKNCDASCGECFEQCVPDGGNTCPGGTEPQWVCASPMPMPAEDQPTPTGGSDGGGPDPDGGEVRPECDPSTGAECSPPSPPASDCWLECVPADPCGPDAHEEWICEDAPPPSCDGPDCGVSSPSCYSICVSDNVCKPGYHEEVVCDGGGSVEPAEPNPTGGGTEPADAPSNPTGGGTEPAPDGTIDPGGCYTRCVADSTCAPGSREEWVCEPVTADSCVPAPDHFCEPSPQKCYLSCVPEDPNQGECPPDTKPVNHCPPTDDGSVGACYIECVSAF